MSGAPRPPRPASQRPASQRPAEVPVGAPEQFTAELWEWDGPAAWHFVSVPDELADRIEEEHGRFVGGFGSVRVEASIGSSTWRTSLFPDTKRATYLLPVKQAVRAKQRIAAGDDVTVALAVLGPAPGPGGRRPATRP